MRGKLRIYLGPAPGVGKTYTMLDEGWRRRQRGADVVIGLVVTHDRPKTNAQIRDLEIVAPRRIEYRGRAWDEVDVAAIIRRRPQIVLVDELAHSNVPGSATEKRWQDIETILASGIEVISTVNIQHLESVNDVVNRITGVVQRETVPDVVVRRADQIELVDMSPETLQRRMAHGNIYPPEKVDAALGNYFRLGNLGALRELALLWVADRVEDSLQGYMAQHGITSSWETRERVLVALTGAPGGGDLIRRAARMARRTKGDLIGAHVVSSDGLTHSKSDLLGRQQRLLEELGGSWHRVIGDDVPSTLVAFATAQHATQIVLGTSRRSRWTEFTQGSIVNRVVRGAEGIDVHVIASEDASPKRLRRMATEPRSARRRPTFPAAAASAIGLLILGAIAADRALPALRQARAFDAGCILAFAVSALLAAFAVRQAALRQAEARRSSDEADAALALVDRLIRPEAPRALIEEIRDTLHRQAVALLAPDGEGWSVEVSAGDRSITGPADGEHYDLRDGRVCVMAGPPLRAAEQCVVAALLSCLEATLDMQRLREEANAVEHLSQANRLRDALLAAVSHDLRTPLASIKALTSGWLEQDVDWPRAATDGFMRSIDSEADRLHKLVENLLDMSRLQSGALELARRPAGLDEIVPAALSTLSAGAHGVAIDVPDTLPLVNVDPALLERAVANLVDNALRHSGRNDRVRVEAATVADRVDVRIVDRGCGIPVAQRERVFQPFQRLGDTASETGVGLGLAVAKGLVDATGGELSIEDTPGGGVTMVIGLPIAAAAYAKERAS